MNRIVVKRSQLAFLLLFVAMAIASHSQTFTALASFDYNNGGDPVSSLAEGLDGNFYGVTPDGGSLNCYPLGCGALFRMSPEGKITLLNNFSCTGACPNGMKPIGGLVRASDGNLYGTTTLGANYQNCSLYLGCGTIFQFSSSDGELRTLHAFDGKTEGGLSSAALIQATDGNLYGTARVGGAADAGTVFEISPQGEVTTLYDFCSEANCADGSSPFGGLVQATNGNFYGTTRGEGKMAGTVFEITPEGVLTTLYTFCTQNNCADGTHPKDSLIQASDGNLYGTTSGGGVRRYGTIFMITLAGKLTTLHRFDLTHGANPYGGLMQATDGNLYGLTFYGGTPGPGVVYRLSTGLKTLIEVGLAEASGRR
jgi:uncharacterized repeat protein (TIGR03803 family)